MRMPLLVAALALAGCDEGTRWRDETYAVIWTDTRETLSLTRRNRGEDHPIHRAGPLVARVGSNADLVVFTVETPEGAADYAILKAQDDPLRSPSEVVIGPLSDWRAWAARHTETPPDMIETTGFPAWLRELRL